MSIKKYNIKKNANACWTQNWQIKNQGVAFDISSCVFEIDFKKKRGPQEPSLLTLKMGDGIDVVDAAEGIIRVFIGIQPNILSNTTYIYDLLMTQGNCSQVLIEGSLEIIPGITYAGD